MEYHNLVADIRHTLTAFDQVTQEKIYQSMNSAQQWLIEYWVNQYKEALDTGNVRIGEVEGEMEYWKEEAEQYKKLYALALEKQLELK